MTTRINVTHMSLGQCISRLTKLRRDKIPVEWTHIHSSNSFFEFDTEEDAVAFKLAYL